MSISASTDDAGSPRISLFPLTFVDEGDQVIIGRPDIDSFAVFPLDAAAVLHKLADGADLASAATWYQDVYGEPVDIEDFADTLRDLGFVRTGEPAELGREATAAPVRWGRLSAVLLSVPALTVYALAVAAAVYFMVRTPALRPVPSTVYFSGSLLVVMLVICAAQLAGIAVHEWFHVLAGRRLGLPSRLTVGRRLYFVVFETTLLGLMGVPSRKRILPFLAGLIADSVLISILIGLAEAGRAEGWPPWLARACVGLAYVTILRVIWQAMIFMETDLYHVLSSAVRCPDLHRMTVTYLRNLIARLRGKEQPAPGDEENWTARELRVVRRYAPVVVAGSVAIIGIAVVSVVPAVYDLALRVYRGVTAGGLATGRFWDALVAGLLALSPFATAAALAFRDRRRRRAASPS